MIRTALLYSTIIISTLGCEDTASLDYEISKIIIETSIEDEKYFLKAETTDVFKCVNYSISFSLDVDNNEVLIEFQGVNKPDGCYTGIGPANAQIDLGSLANGIYNVSFLLNGITTNAIMEIDHEFSLEVIDDSSNVVVR